MWPANGSFCVACSEENRTRIYKKRVQDQIVAFMMAWHPRLGQNAQISFYVPKVVAKEIIAKKLIEYMYWPGTKKKRSLSVVHFSITQLHDVNFKLRNKSLRPNEYEEWEPPELHVLYPNLSAYRYCILNPKLILSDDIDDANTISFEEMDSKFIELIDVIILKIQKVYPLASWTHRFEVTKHHTIYRQKPTKTNIGRDAAKQLLKKGTTVLVAFEYNYFGSDEFKWIIREVVIYPDK